MNTLFVTTESVRAQTEARRERLTRDWQQRPRRDGAPRRRHLALQLALHLPVRVRRHA